MCLKAQSISAWVWLVESEWRSLFLWETTHLLSQSIATGGIVSWYEDAAAFKMNCIITPLSISPGYGPAGIVIWPMCTYSALWQLCSISLLPPRKCLLIFPSCMSSELRKGVTAINKIKKKWDYSVAREEVSISCKFLYASNIGWLSWYLEYPATSLGEKQMALGMH